MEASGKVYLTVMKLITIIPLLFLFACGQATNDEVKEVSIPNADLTMQAPDSLLRHAVLFSFTEESYPDGPAQVENAFRALPEKISEIHSFEWGINNSPEGLDKGYTHLFFVTFTSEEDRAAYLPHPDHQAFVEVLKPHLKDVLVLDYWAKQ